MRTKLSWCLLLMIGLLAGCASSNSGVGGKGKVTFNGRAGSATAPDLRAKTEKMFTKYQYEVVRQEESSDSFYFETNWKFREPFLDEKALNVVSARTRIIIQSRPKMRAATTGNADIHSVQVTGENQVRYAGSDEWVNMAIGQNLESYFRKFCNELDMEFQSGFGRF